MLITNVEKFSTISNTILCKTENQLQPRRTVCRNAKPATCGGKETKMIQTYPNNVRLIVNLDTEESRLMVGSRLLDIYNGTDIEKMRRITSAAESLSLTIGHRSPDRVRILS